MQYGHTFFPIPETRLDIERAFRSRYRLTRSRYRSTIRGWWCTFCGKDTDGIVSYRIRGRKTWYYRNCCWNCFKETYVR